MDFLMLGNPFNIGSTILLYNKKEKWRLRVVGKENLDKSLVFYSDTVV
jgi:hypothetical protein